MKLFVRFIELSVLVHTVLNEIACYLFQKFSGQLNIASKLFWMQNIAIVLSKQDKVICYC